MSFIIANRAGIELKLEAKILLNDSPYKVNAYCYFMGSCCVDKTRKQKLGDIDNYRKIKGINHHG